MNVVVRTVGVYAALLIAGAFATCDRARSDEVVMKLTTVFTRPGGNILGNHLACGGGVNSDSLCKPTNADSFRVYTRGETDGLLKSITDAAAIIDHSVGALQVNVESFRNEMRESILTSLRALPSQLLGDNAREQIAADVVAKIQAQVGAEISQLRTQLRQDITMEFESRMATIETQLGLPHER